MAQDDLRYPGEMVAPKHWERPTSNLPARGLMPGKPHQELEKEDHLISGRGLIP